MIVTINKTAVYYGVKPIKKRLTKTLLKKWAKMTDENNHREVRVEIADFFDQKSRADYFRKDAITWDEKEQTYVYSNFGAYCDVAAMMLQEIKDTCGEEVYNLIRHCL